MRGFVVFVVLRSSWPQIHGQDAEFANIRNCEQHIGDRICKHPAEQHGHTHEQKRSNSVEQEEEGQRRPRSLLFARFFARGRRPALVALFRLIAVRMVSTEN
jgi:hypothetical protein